MASSAPAAKTWYDHLPTPKSQPRPVGCQELRDLIQADGHGVLLVDVRRTDIEPPMDFMLPGAINLPAQTFYQTLPTLLRIFQQYTHVVFHCGSSSGRGPRCAAWYQDYIEEKGLKNNAFVLEGGIKAYHRLHPNDLVSL